MENAETHSAVEKVRVKMRLEFDGSGFCGWQMQDPDREGAGTHLESIQGVIERGLLTYLRRPRDRRIVVQGCGRTDAGVHAREFFCHFDLDIIDVPQTADAWERMRHSLNCIVPAGLSVTHLGQTADTFHALNDVTKKIYEYSIFFRRAKPTLDHRSVWWIPRNFEPNSIDFKALERCLKKLIGRHDFKAFMASNSSVKTTERTIQDARSQVIFLGSDPAAGSVLKLRFIGDGFLKHQVRNMVGALMDVAQGQMTEAHFIELIEHPERTRVDAGYCAPPNGLTLLQVYYGYPTKGSVP